MMDQALEGLDEPLNITADEKEKNGNKIALQKKVPTFWVWPEIAFQKLDFESSSVQKENKHGGSEL